MSFFSKILKGLGFEDDDEEQKPKPVKQKKEKSKPVRASFDLTTEEVAPKEPEPQPQEQQQPSQPQTIQQQPSFNLDIIKVQSQIEVQNVVKKIKNGERVIINLSALNEQDLTRSLDFLTGAVYALDKAMQKVDNSIFIIQ
ncbi:MAG: cell division protein SepF [Clostridia bacterium]|nr:cell division protein SepF [Clostridia bacterium]